MTYAMLWFDSFEFDFHFLCFMFIVKLCSPRRYNEKKKKQRKKDENQAQHNSKLQHKKNVLSRNYSLCNYC